MKKKISLLLCILIASLSFAGCGSSEQTFEDADKENVTAVSEKLMEAFVFSDYEGLAAMKAAQEDPTDAEAYAKAQEAYTKLQAVAETEDFQFAYMISDVDAIKESTDFHKEALVYSLGLKCDGDTLCKMLDAWKAGTKECGGLKDDIIDKVFESWSTEKDVFEFEVEEKSSSMVVSTEVEFKDRTATVSFTFDEGLNVESFDVAAKYTTGEILTKAGLNTLLGMGTVFAVLIFLAFIIYLMKFIPMFMDKLQKKEAAPEALKAAPVAAPVVVEETDDLELVAVISAAIAASEGTSADGFVVRSIKRRPSNNWN